MAERGKDTKVLGVTDPGPVDLAARIGSRSTAAAGVAVAEIPQRFDGPLPSRRATERPTIIGNAEPAPAAAVARTSAPSPEIRQEKAKSEAIASPRAAPGPGEIDIVATPLPTPDDWHRFEIALHNVRGVTQLRPEYYRHGVAKMRVVWSGQDRLAQTLRGGLPGFRVRILGEDRATLQILVSADNDQRRPS
jgi:hypothetical protein